MSRDLDDLDFDLDDEDLPLVEIEFDEEDEKSSKVGTVLKVLLIVLIVCALLAAGFFVVRYVLGQQSPKFETTSIATPEPTPTPAPTPEPTPTVTLLLKSLRIDPGDLSAVRAYIQGELDAMAADVNYPNVDEYTVNEDCTVFTAVCTSLNESAAERGAADKMYEFGRMYAAYAGTTVDNIHIDYRNHMGDLLWTRDSGK